MSQQKSEFKEVKAQAFDRLHSVQLPHDKTYRMNKRYCLCTFKGKYMFAKHSILSVCIIYTTWLSIENTAKQMMFNIICSSQYMIVKCIFNLMLVSLPAVRKMSNSKKTVKSSLHYRNVNSTPGFWKLDWTHCKKLQRTKLKNNYANNHGFFPF